MINKDYREYHFLSVDLEDWFTSAYLRDYVGNQNPVSRILETSKQILDVFENNNIKATFFVLGSIVESNPDLIKIIHQNGHEIASHGYSHTPLWELNKNSFEEEIKKTNALISNITNKKVKGFRAPYASLDHSTAWMLDILEKYDFLYDSSIFPMRTPLYGCKDAPLASYKISSNNIIQHNSKAKLIEVPFSVYQCGIIKIPCTGGIYGRFLPSFILHQFLKSISKSRSINFYFHPWEIDKEIPKIKVPLYNTIVSYYNTKNYLNKINYLVKKYKFTSFEKKLNLI